MVDGRGRLLRVPLPVREAEPVAEAEDVAGVASAGGWVWAASGGELLRIDPVDGHVAARVLSPHPATGAPPGALVADQDSLWLGGTSDSGGALLVRLDRGTGQSTAVIELGSMAERSRPQVAAGQGVVATRVGPDLHLVDPATGAVQATVALGDILGGVAADGHTIWATDPTRGCLLRIDPGF